MDNDIAMTNTRSVQIYATLLWIYPKPYRKKFGQEMLFAFSDLYQERLTNDGSIGLRFWSSILFDTIQSGISQHLQLVRSIGMKKYFEQTLHINKYNVIGGILLLPFLTMFVIDLIARIIQRDLVHYNRPVYAAISHTFLYRTPVLFTWVIGFPILAVLINLIPLITNRTGKVQRFLQINVISLSIIVLGLLFLAFIRLHDFAPCMFFGLTHFGLGQLPHIISVCRNA